MVTAGDVGGTLNYVPASWSAAVPLRTAALRRKEQILPNEPKGKCLFKEARPGALGVLGGLSHPRN